MKQRVYEFIFLVVSTLIFTSMPLFAQQSARLDWSKFNGLTVCAQSSVGTFSAKTQEFKIKKVLQKKEVSFDVGKITDLLINNQPVTVANCASLPISQVSMGTTSRCFASQADQRYYIYIQRIVNQVSGTQQQSITIQSDNNNTFQLSQNSCP